MVRNALARALGGRKAPLRMLATLASDSARYNASQIINGLKIGDWTPQRSGAGYKSAALGMTCRFRLHFKSGPP